MTPRVITRIVGFTEVEWRMIRGAARSLAASGADTGTLIFPGRPELYRLTRTREGVTLELETEIPVAISAAKASRT